MRTTPIRKPALPKRRGDEYHYPAADQPLGWTRWREENAGGFTAERWLILRRDAAGQSAEAEAVCYAARFALVAESSCRRLSGEPILLSNRRGATPLWMDGLSGEGR